MSANSGEVGAQMLNPRESEPFAEIALATSPAYEAMSCLPINGQLLPDSSQSACRNAGSQHVILLER